MWFIKVPITYTLEEYKEQMGFYDSYKEIKMIYFENYNLLKEQYKGEIDTTYVITTYTNLIDKYFNKIYQNTKDLKEEEIEKYIKENLAEIQINMGLAEVEEFINLVNILKSYKISERAYTGGKLLENSIKDYDTYMSFLLEMYYDVIDPTSINRQGGDTGSQYRTGIYYVDPKDESIIKHSIMDLQKNYDEKIAIEVEPLTQYFIAEEYHQKYLDKNPGGYCHIRPDKFLKAENAIDSIVNDN